MEPLDPSRFYDPLPTRYTERLVLRPLRLSDAEAMFEYHSDPEVTRYVHFGPAASVEQTREVISHILRELEQQKGFDFAVALRDTDWLIGTLDLHTISLEHRRLEVGLMMTRKYWGSGYAFEALREAIRFCFEELGIHRIEVSIDEGNVRSERLAQRCGMTYEGKLRENERSKGRFVSNTIYSILHND
jgi:[ribosomal protein S5]-alanine N-acetyltransferase